MLAFLVNAGYFQSANFAGTASASELCHFSHFEVKVNLSMSDLIRRFFGVPAPAGEEQERESPVRDVRVAACALFLEMANIDGEFSEKERAKFFSIIKKEYDLSSEVADQLFEEAAAELRSSLDLWKFTNLVNENYTDAEKIKVIELLWKIIFADGKLDMHEDYLVHKLATLLNIEHRQLITAKLEVLSEIASPHDEAADG